MKEVNREAHRRKIKLQILPTAETIKTLEQHAEKDERDPASDMLKREPDGLPQEKSKSKPGLSERSVPTQRAGTSSGGLRGVLFSFGAGSVATAQDHYHYNIFFL